MIDVTKMNGSKVTVNTDLIETVEDNERKGRSTSD